MGAVILFPATRRDPANDPRAAGNTLYADIYRCAQACDAALRIGDFYKAFSQIEFLLDIELPANGEPELCDLRATIAEELFQRVTTRLRENRESVIDPSDLGDSAS